MTKNITCIICPKGCSLTAEINEGIVCVNGNTCERGKQYATDECLNPTRTVTSMVRVSNKCNCMVSVKTVKPIPKGKIFETMELIRGAEVCAPVSIGDVILEDVFGTQVIATKNIDR